VNPTTAERVRRLGSIGGIPAMIVAILIFATGSTLVRKVHGNGVTIACYRSLIASAIWQLIMATQGRHLTWAIIRRAGPLGALMGANIACFFTGVTKTSIASAELIGTLSPVLLLPAGALIYKEKIPWRALPWGLGALGGLLLVLFNAPARGRTSWAGNGLIIVAVLSWATYLLISKNLRKTIPVPELMSTITLGSGIVLLPFVAISGRWDGIPVRGLGWFALLVMLGGVLGQTMILIAQRTLPIGTISTMQVAQPAIAVISAYLFLDESLRPIQVVGIVVVMISLLFFARTAQRIAMQTAAAPGPGPESFAAE
jgi:drug/metabolite transporter (DMT)-like permease